jgi:MerR family transcriptional regulator, light-induced transcriptional regulator
MFTIAAVERDVGLSKDVLRVWERRYGFPAPKRAGNGERLYPAEQVERLRVIKRLMDQGHRPGRLLSSSLKQLSALAAHRPDAAPAPGVDGLDRLVALVTRHEVDAFVQALQQRLAREGLQRFVQDTVAPLTALVGVAWQEGRLQVFEEHLFTELTERVLRHAIAAVPGGQQPRVLLTSAPREQHALGLLMAEAVFTLEGALCIPLGTEMPLLEIARAASAHRADIVALSFSSAFPRRQIPGLLHELRGAMPLAIELWAGGSGVRRIAPSPGVQVIATLQDAATGLAGWRSAH